MRLFLILILSVSLLDYNFAETPKKKEKPKKKERFVFKPIEFMKPGLDIQVDSGLGTRKGTIGNHYMPGEVLYYAYLASAYNTTYPFKYSYEWTRDSIARDNLENYSYISQKKSSRVIPNRLRLRYTFKKLPQFSIEGALRGTFQKSNYTLYHLPNYPGVTSFRYYPGTRKYIWQDSQINIVGNEAVNKWLMVNPIIGVRKEVREYSKSTIPIPYDSVDSRFYRYFENSTIFSYQSGIRFHFKLSEKFRLKLTTKVFYENKGKIKIEKDIIDGLSTSAYTFYHQKSSLVHKGHEHELESVYHLGNVRLHLGYNYTVYQYKQEDALPPLILNLNYDKVVEGYLDYIFRRAVYQSENSLNGIGTFHRGRAEYLKYLFFGVSYHF